VSHRFSEDKKFKITPARLFRWSVFLILFYLSLSYFASHRLPDNSDPTTVLGENTAIPNLSVVSQSLLKSLPQSSQRQLQNLPQSPVIIYIQDRLKFIQEQSVGFPQKQITEIKKSLVEKIYQDLMDNLNQSK